MKLRPKHALGILIKNRWEYTHQTLISLEKSRQDKSTYDLFIIDNDSDQENIRKLKQYAASSTLPIKRLFFIEDASISIAWNLFLKYAKEYEFKTKMDNDLVIESNIKILDKLESFSKQKNIDIAALIPLNKGVPFKMMLENVLAAKASGIPYLYGACMMISRKCFEKIGYFDERIERRMDIEYSHRAIRNRLRIGYPDDCWIRHLGAGRKNVTEEWADVKRRANIAKKIELDSPIKTYANSVWES